MTAAELSTFIAEIRSECDERLALLAATDPATLPAELVDEYHDAVASWTAIWQLTDEEVVALHVEACRLAERELTPDELRALLGTQ